MVLDWLACIGIFIMCFVVCFVVSVGIANSAKNREEQISTGVILVFFNAIPWAVIFCAKYFGLW